MRKNGIIPGGGCPELFLANFLSQRSRSLPNQGYYIYKSISSAFEIIPKTISENCGSLIDHVFNEVKSFHKKGRIFCGMDGKNGCIVDVRKLGIFELFDVKSKLIKSSFENVSMLLRIDTILTGVSSNKNRLT